MLRKLFGKSFALLSIVVALTLISALFPVSVKAAEPTANGYQISQWTGETWQAVYQHQFQVQYSTEAFTTSAVDGKVILRIVQSGKPYADVDQISLIVGNEQITPEYARYTSNGLSILEDVLQLDHNVVLAHEQEIEMSWDVPSAYDQVTVNLTANEYGASSPFQFPDAGYATYKLGSNTSSITVDGLIDETDGTVPLYSPFWYPATGHPDGYTYIYVSDDEQYVYFSLDVTPDNTNEYGVDWAEMRILKSDGSEQAFRANDYDSTWGKGGFGLTSKVSYKHQTYEFAIPKSIIGNEDIQFGLAYYGTAGGSNITNPGVATNHITINGSGTTGQVFHVGQTLDIDGYVTSMALITAVAPGDYIKAYLDWNIQVQSGSTLEAYDQDSRQSNNFGNTAVIHQVQVSTNNQNISVPLTLATPGSYTISLYSNAAVSRWTSNLDPLDDEQTDGQGSSVTKMLSFTVVPNKTADLITEGGDNPTDIGDLKVTYGAGKFHVEYLLDAPWEIVNTQVYIGTAYPTKSSPGQFPYTAGDITFNPGSATKVYIAAHAKIRMQTGIDTRGRPIYVYAGVWAQTGTDIKIGKGTNWATYFVYGLPGLSGLDIRNRFDKGKDNSGGQTN